MMFTFTIIVLVSCLTLCDAYKKHSQAQSFNAFKNGGTSTFRCITNPEHEAEITLSSDQTVRNITFKNGDTLTFKCVTTKSKHEAEITLSSDETVKVEVQEKRPGVFCGSYKMEFISTSVQAKCSIFDKNKIVKATYRRGLQRKVVGQDDARGMPYQENDVGGFFRDNYKFLVLAAGVVILIIIISLIIKCCCAYRKRRIQHKTTKVLYDNLSEGNSQLGRSSDGSKSEPAYMTTVNALGTQKEDTNPYSLPYVEKDSSNLHSKPVPKSHRQADLSLQYASVIPKSQRVKEEVLYTQLSFCNEEARKFKSEKMPAYATLQKGGSNSNSVEGAKYENVFDGKPYNNVNNRNDDFVEPSYCEIAKMAK